MSNKIINQTQQRLEQIQQNYQHSFAGHPRASRKASLLLAWVTQLEEWMQQIKPFKSQAAQDLHTQIKGGIELYQKEYQLIVSLQKSNEAVRKSYDYIEWTNIIKQKYVRHFAGMSRVTRDIELLKEMILELKIHGTKIEKHQQNHAQELNDVLNDDLTQHFKDIQNEIALYTEELKQIHTAREELSEENKGNLWAELANHQFNLYRRHFSNRSRQSRRLDLLERVNLNLTYIRRNMEAVGSDFDLQLKNKNIAIVDQNMELYATEIENIQKVQNQMGYDEWVQTLKLAFDQVESEYTKDFAGQSRQTRNLIQIQQLADEAYDIAYQIKPFLQNSPHVEEQDLLRQVLDQVRNYHREFTLIQTAQSKSSKTSGQSKTNTNQKKKSFGKSKNKSKKKNSKKTIH